MLLLDIEIPVEPTVTKTDREILYSHLGEDAETFVYIDTYLDYLKEFNSRKDMLSRRTNSKVVAEYLPIISKNLHSIKVKKEARNEFIVPKEGVTIQLTFAPRIFYKNKVLLGPINTPLQADSFKLLPIYDVTGKHSSVNNLKVESIDDLPAIVKFYNGIQFQKPVEEFTGYSVNLEPPPNLDFDFLTSKPSSLSPIALRYSFDIDNNLPLLENILNYGIDKNMDILTAMRSNALAAVKYNIGVSKLIKETAKISRLEQLCKVKFPNLFNKSSREYIFGNFDLSAMPPDYRKALLREYAIKSQIEEKMLNNKCEHISAMVELRNKPTDDSFKKVKQFISKDKCSLCDLQVACPHEIEYYSLLVESKDSIINKSDRIEQLITTKYADSKKSKMYASFCKLCGMKVLDMAVSDDVNYSSNEMYSSEEMSEDKKLVTQVAASNLMFTKPTSKNTAYKIVNSVWNSIAHVVSQLSSSKSKGDIDKKINIIVLTITSIISMSFNSDFIELQGVKSGAKINKNEMIIQKKSVSDSFRNALQVFTTKYAKFIRESSYSNKPELLRQLFVKAYKLIKDSVEIYARTTVDQTKSTVDDYLTIFPKTEYGKKSKEQFENNLNGVQPNSLNEMEKQLIENHTTKLLYPYSQIKYSYSRYYKQQSKWSKDMILYACPATGKRHSWGSYISKNGEYKIKSIKEPLRNVTEMRCSDCKLSTKELMSSKKDINKLVTEIVKEINNINSFYSVFRYRCLKQDFHSFIDDKCSVCKMHFSFIVNKDREFCMDHINELIKYNDKNEYSKNESLEKHKEFNKLVGEMKIEIPTVKVDPENYSWVAPENKLKLKNIGNTEGKEFIEYDSMDYPVTMQTDVFTKLIDRLRQLLIYIGILVNKPRNHKYSKNNKFSEVNGLKKLYTSLVQERIVENAWKTKNDKYAKNKILSILNRLQEWPEAFKFAMNAIIDSDTVFTKYDYAELKKTFNLAKVIEDSFKETNEPETDDSFDLFDSSDLTNDDNEDD